MEPIRGAEGVLTPQKTARERFRELQLMEKNSMNYLHSVPSTNSTNWVKEWSLVFPALKIFLGGSYPSSGVPKLMGIVQDAYLSGTPAKVIIPGMGWISARHRYTDGATTMVIRIKSPSMCIPEYKDIVQCSKQRVGIQLIDTLYEISAAINQVKDIRPEIKFHKKALHVGFNLRDDAGLGKPPAFTIRFCWGRLHVSKPLPGERKSTLHGCPTYKYTLWRKKFAEMAKASEANPGYTEEILWSESFRGQEEERSVGLMCNIDPYTGMLWICFPKRMMEYTDGIVLPLWRKSNPIFSSTKIKIRAKEIPITHPTAREVDSMETRNIGLSDFSLNRYPTTHAAIDCYRMAANIMLYRVLDNAIRACTNNTTRILQDAPIEKPTGNTLIKIYAWSATPLIQREDDNGFQYPNVFRMDAMWGDNTIKRVPSLAQFAYDALWRSKIEYTKFRGRTEYIAESKRITRLDAYVMEDNALIEMVEEIRLMMPQTTYAYISPETILEDPDPPPTEDQHIKRLFMELALNSN
jgi:hypothetical protein